MKSKVPRLLWLLLLLYKVIGIIDLSTSHTNENLFSNVTLPQPFVYFVSRIDVIGQNGSMLVSVLWSHFLVNGGVLLLLIMPTCLVGVRSSSCQRFINRLLWCDLIILIIYCLVDFFGCIISVSSPYQPLFSIIIDIFVIALSLWTFRVSTVCK